MQEYPSTSPAPIIQVQPASNNRLPLWILLSVFVGFMLPVCSCAVLGLGFASSLSLFGDGTTSSGGLGDAIAIVRVEGTITSGDDTDVSTDATSGTVIADLRAANNDPTVKAIVLRVDSPGGSVTGSAQIYEVMREMDKPVIVSMAGVAASGGYYVSAPADYIFARPDTTTGSIGVILTLFNAQELIDEIGVDVIAITSGPNKALGSFWEEITPEQQAIFEEALNEAYDDFVQVIVDGRNLEPAAVRELADGRTYTGSQALKLGLVDELGNFQDAIAKAAEMGGISGEPRLVEFEHLPGLQQLLSGFSTRLNQTPGDQALSLMSELAIPAIEYRYVGPASQ
ncbi:MAG: signal peptide peptidase SppA [Anaerolineales bacterium]|nr:signal peptide peptidase SppA [Anaerolineales bacterium]